jgi:glycosyltransferase involved in cell wall biosynthesis
LSARGIEVTTVTTNHDGGARTLAVECGKALSANGATRWYFARNLQFYAVSMGLSRWLKRNIAQFDIVHAHGLFSFAPVMAARIAKRAGVPYVLRPFGVLNRYGMTQRRPLLKQMSLALLERPLIEAASAVQFTSRAEQAEAALLNLQCKSTVIPLGIDTSNISKTTTGRHKAELDRPRILFLSRIDPKKNIEALLGAVSRLKAKYPNLVLDIAGDGVPEYVQTLKSRASDFGIADRVCWHGYVADQAKVDLFASATLFALPSFSESFGIAVIEALAAGLPCVVSRDVAVHEEIEKAGAGAITGTDADSIVNGLEAVLSNESGLPQMRLAAVRLAENFSLPIMGERLEKLYRSVLQ